MKILIIEDNYILAEEIANYFKNQGFIVEHASSFNNAKDKINVYSYDSVVLDLGLPDGNGLDLIFPIKEKDSSIGIIILTAKNSIEDKIKGLDLGADDYLTKPFHIEELYARIRSVLRRNKFDSSNKIEFNEISIDLYEKSISVKDVQIEFTKKEFDLLLYFIYNKNRVLTKENIAEHLWGDIIDQSDNFDFIYNHIRNIRKKLLANNCGDYIKSVYGIGYKFSN